MTFIAPIPSHSHKIIHIHISPIPTIPYFHSHFLLIPLFQSRSMCPFPSICTFLKQEAKKCILTY